MIKNKRQDDVMDDFLYGKVKKNKKDIKNEKDEKEQVEKI